MIESSKRHWLRLVAILAVLAIVAAACGGGDSTDDTDATEDTEAPVETTEGGDSTDDTEGGDDGDDTDGGEAGGSFDTYALGMTSDITTTNWWNYYGPEGTVYNQYVLAGNKPSLFGIEYPAIQVVPSLAVGLPAEPVEEGDTWTITQEMRGDYQWSDGTPVTAADVAFTYRAASEAALGGDWLSAYPYTEESNPQLTSVEAIDDTTVKFTFTERPGLGVWPHNVGVAPIMPAHVWEAALEEALTSEDPAGALYGADASVDVSAGSTSFDSWEEGAFVRNVANDNYSDAGVTRTVCPDGGVQVDGEVIYDGDFAAEGCIEYTEGPFLSEQTFSIYADQSAAMLALVNGEVDYWINPLGVSPGLREQGLNAENLSVAVNPTNGMRYLAFNLRKSPGQYKGYRQAVAYMIDKEFLTQNVLQGVAFPMYLMVPEGNQKFYDAELAAELQERYAGLSEAERITAATEALKADGFTWETEPSVDEEGVITYGVGLIDPEGNPVTEQEILAPPASYDPLRATASLWIEGWMENLGIPARANPTDFNTIVAKIWPGVGEEIGFDTYILGWSLGNPALPTFHEAFWHSRNLAEVNDGNNSTGFQNADFDAAADAVLAAQTEEDALTNILAAERILAEELPYVVLFDTPITEFYSNELAFPFTQTLSGLQFNLGFPGSVAK